MAHVAGEIHEHRGQMIAIEIEADGVRAVGIERQR
jgi:hypothetical protein